MSSSSSAPAPARSRIIRGASFPHRVSPLEAEIPLPAAPVDPVAAAAEERRGYDDGYRAGMAEGLAAARAAMAAESATATARLEALGRALGDAGDDLRRRQALDLTDLEDTLARTAVDLASAIIGRELQISASPGADALARALALVPAGSMAVARLHPADAAVLAEAEAGATTGVAGSGAAGGIGEVAGGYLAARGSSTPASVTIIADPAVEPGGCILEVGESRIDAQLGPALDRVRAALLGDRPVPHRSGGAQPGSGR
jgi:flagellar assembly protein FliH